MATPPHTPATTDSAERHAEQTKAPQQRAALNAAGERRPAFLLSFPHDPELDVLIAAFEAGDFARVKRDAPSLVASASHQAVSEAAQELLTRTTPDPLLKLLLLASVALFAFVVMWTYVH